MTYKELKREIIQASKDQKATGIAHYIAYWGNNSLVSNFMEVVGVTDNQLIRAIDEGLLIKDWDVLEVV